LSAGIDIGLNINTSLVTWRPCHRLIASRFPTVGLYDGLAAAEDLDVVFAIEALTNPRVRQELGQLNLVPSSERVVGPGATLIMAAFTHLNPLGSRFSDGSWGVYYAASSLPTAVAEVGFHRAAFLARTAEPPIDVDLRWIQADVAAALHDLRDPAPALTAALDPAHYGASQDLARDLRGQGSAGIVWHSVRERNASMRGQNAQAPGQCVALFKPKALSKARAAGHITLHWNGAAITHWFEKRAPHLASFNFQS
jgi:RES domain